MTKKTDELFGEYQVLMFPAVITDSGGKCIFKNTAARKCFPLLKIGTTFSRYSGCRVKPGHISLENVYGMPYIVTSVPIPHGRKTVTALFFADCGFAEDKEVISAIVSDNEAMIEEMRSLVLSVCSDTADDTAKLRERVKSVIARTNELREYNAVFLHALRIAKRNHAGETVLCSAESLLSAVGEKMRLAGIMLEVCCPGDICFEAYPADVAFIIINILRFIRIYSGEKNIGVSVARTGAGCEMEFSFADTDGVITAFCEAASARSGREIRQLASFCPLYCASVFCRRNGYGTRLVSDNGICRLVLEIAGEAKIGADEAMRSDFAVAKAVESVFSELYPYLSGECLS